MHPSRGYGDETDPYGGFQVLAAGTEAEHLAASLNRQRTTFRCKADDLDTASLRQRLGPGGLFQRLIIVETLFSDLQTRGEPLIAPSDASDLERCWEASTDADDPEDWHPLEASHRG